MNRYRKGEAGQGIVEYTLILVLALVIAVIVLVLLGPSLGDVFSAILNTLEST